VAGHPYCLAEESWKLRCCSRRSTGQTRIQVYIYHMMRLDLWRATVVLKHWSLVQVLLDVCRAQVLVRQAPKRKLEDSYFRLCVRLYGGDMMQERFRRLQREQAPGRPGSASHRIFFIIITRAFQSVSHKRQTFCCLHSAHAFFFRLDEAESMVCPSSASITWTYGELSDIFHACIETHWDMQFNQNAS
jgi:hypothetical protein